MDRSQFAGKLVILDTCILYNRRGRTEDLIGFLEEIGATAAITSTILNEVLSSKSGYLFPLQDKEEILHLVRNGRLKFFDLPPVGNLIDRILDDLKYPFWRGYIERNSRDYLVALTALNNKALFHTENILDFEVWKAFGLQCFNSLEIDQIRYG